jgi:hypothetical protein
MPTPPDLQALVESRGGWDKVTELDWRRFDRQRAAFADAVRSGDGYQRIETETPKPKDEAELLPEPPDDDAPPLDDDADVFDESKYEIEP